MAAPSKTFTALTDAEIAANKLLTTEKMTKIRDALSHLEEWLGKDYTAAQNHNHDGVNSAEIEVGPNYVRNSSFEQGTDGWTTAGYTGGTVATNTSNDMDGDTCLAITSSVLANGGGEAYTTGYTPCSGGKSLDVVAMVKASVTGQSAKLSVIWYDDALAQISESTAWSSTSAPIVATPVGDRLIAPATARFARVKLVGGVPASGSATGTIYLDGVLLTAWAPIAVTGSTNIMQDTISDTSTTSTSLVEAVNFQTAVGGNLSIKYTLASDGGAFFSEARTYVNGVAVGTLQFASTPAAAYTDNIPVSPGDTIQIYIRSQTGGHTTFLTAISICAGNPRMTAGAVTQIPGGRRY
jgi:hypothetical protein